MKKELQYALVTSSALPREIAASNYYTELDKTQWLDLIDYSEELVKTDKDQEILFLIVAKGTADQIEEDEARRQQKEQEKRDLQSTNSSLSDTLATLDADKSSLSQKIKDLNAQIFALTEELDSIKEDEQSEEAKQRELDAAADGRQKRVRERSISLFNALYTK